MKTVNLYRGLPQKSPESIVVSGLLRLRKHNEIPIRLWRGCKDARSSLKMAARTLITKYPKKPPEILRGFREIRDELPAFSNPGAHQIIHEKLLRYDVAIDTVLSVPRRWVRAYSSELTKELDSFFPHSQDAYLVVIVKDKVGTTRLLY